MTQTASIWLVIVVAFCAANLPFLSQRVLGIIAISRPKSLGVRLAELVVFYFLSGALGLLLEKRAGQIASQTWEFYAITATLFITLAFPGFVYRYLVRRHG